MMLNIFSWPFWLFVYLLWGNVYSDLMPIFKKCTLSFIYLFLNIYLFIWLHWVLVAVCGIFIVTCGIFIAVRGLFVAAHGLLSSCVTQALDCIGSVVVAHRLSSCGVQA